MSYRAWSVAVTLFIILVSTVHADLVHNYPLDGHANDGVGEKNGTMQNTVPTTDRHGHDRGALHFNGTDAYVVMPSFDSVLNVDKDWSLNVWANTTVGVGEGTLFGGADGGSGMKQFSFSPISNRVTSSADTGADYHIVDGNRYHNKPNGDGAWHMYTLTWDNAGVFSFYIDGILFGTDTTGALADYYPESWAPVLGANREGLNRTIRSYFDGAMDDFRIYNHTLSQKEITNLALSGGFKTLKQGNNDKQAFLLIRERDQIIQLYDTGDMSMFLSRSGMVRVHDNKIYVADRTRSGAGGVSIYDGAVHMLGTVPVPTEVSYYVDFVVIPDGRIAFLDNRDDVVYFVSPQGAYITSVRMNRVPGGGLQNTDGVVVDNRLIVSENGHKQLLAIDLDTYTLSVFRDLQHLPSPCLGAIAFNDGYFYICTPDVVYSFAPDDTKEQRVAVLPRGARNITGIVHDGEYLYVTVNHTGGLYSIDPASGEVDILMNNLDYPDGIARFGTFNGSLATTRIRKPNDTPSSEDNATSFVHLTPTHGIMGSMIRYYRPIRSTLSDQPSEVLRKEPQYRSTSPLYGTMQLGDGQDRVITVVLDEPENGPARIYIDCNNDEDLTNDGDGAWSSESSSSLKLPYVRIDVDYTTGPMPYTFSFYRFKNRSRDGVLYYRNSARQGRFLCGGHFYKIAVIDENADGCFDDLYNGTLLIDLNGDEKLIGSTDSAERFELDKPFNVHGKVWQVERMSADGSVLTLQSSEVETTMRAYLEPGYPAPLFSGRDLEGNPIELSKGAEYILLDFWASWSDPCRIDFPYLRRMHAGYRDRGLRILGINLDSQREAAQKAAEENGLDYPHVFDGLGWKNAVALQYRVNGIPQTYLLDSDLNIVAKNLRGARLERKIAELLGPADEKAIRAIEAGHVKSISVQAEVTQKPSERASGPATITMPMEKLEIPSDMHNCGENFKKIYTAIKQYEKDKGQLPDWLTDLVPEYLNQETLFCPQDSRHRAPYSPDPKAPCSYGWQFSARPIPSGHDPTGRTFYRDWKREQVKIFGDMVPMVRCYHHGSDRVLNLSAGGDLWWGALTWEHNFHPDYGSIHQQTLTRAVKARSGSSSIRISQPVRDRSYLTEASRIPDKKRDAVWATYNRISPKTIADAAFTTHKVDGSKNENNQLVPGSIFLYKTNEDRLGKLLIEQYGYNLTLAWTTYNRNGEIHSQGKNLQIRGSKYCELDQGKEGKDVADFWWQQATEVERYLSPRNKAMFAKHPSGDLSGNRSPTKKESDLKFKVMLDYTTEIRGSSRPQKMQLSSNAPPQEWILPSQSGSSSRRYWGRKTFGHSTLMNVVVDIPPIPSMSAWQVFVAFGDNADFKPITPISIAKGERKRIEFDVAYSDGTVNPYVIDIEQITSNRGRYYLRYYRRCHRIGILELPDSQPFIIISDYDCDGLYSDLQDTFITIDGDRFHSVPGTSSIKLGDSQFFSADISDDGSWIAFQPAKYGLFEGQVTCTSTKVPVAGATLKLTPHGFSIQTDEKGYYRLRLPVGRYASAQITAPGFIPTHVRLSRVPFVSDENPVRFDAILDPAVIPEPGELTLANSNSYHFLSGQRYPGPGEGDFCFGFSKGEPGFWAGNQYQGGLIDLGALDNSLESIDIPESGYNRRGVRAHVGHVYVSRAKEGETGCYIVFRVKEITHDERCVLEYVYRQTGSRTDDHADMNQQISLPVPDDVTHNDRAVSTVFYADYEQSPIGEFPRDPLVGIGRFVTRGSEKAVVESSLGSNHTNVLVLRDTERGEKRSAEVHCYLEQPLTGNIAVEWDAVISEANGDEYGFVYNVCAIGGTGRRDGVAWDLPLTKRGFYEGGQYLPFEKNRVYHFRVEMDTDRLRYSASIDGSAIATDVAFNNEISDQLNRITFSTHWNATCVVGIDNIIVHSQETKSKPEPDKVTVPSIPL